MASVGIVMGEWPACGRASRGVGDSYGVPVWLPGAECTEPDADCAS